MFGPLCEGQPAPSVSTACQRQWAAVQRFKAGAHGNQKIALSTPLVSSNVAYSAKPRFDASSGGSTTPPSRVTSAEMRATASFRAPVYSHASRKWTGSSEEKHTMRVSGHGVSARSNPSAQGNTTAG